MKLLAALMLMIGSAVAIRLGGPTCLSLLEILVNNVYEKGQGEK